MMERIAAAALILVALAACRPDNQGGAQAPSRDSYAACIDARVGNDHIPTQADMDFCNSRYPT